MVESLQSQVKQLQETIRLRKRNKTSSVRKKVLLLKVSKQTEDWGKNEIINSSSSCRNATLYYILPESLWYIVLVDICTSV